jgi:hypothetical protein
MPDHRDRDIAELYVKAVTTDGDDDAFASVLDDDVLSVSALGRQTGRDAVLAAVKNPMLKPLLATGEWSDPSVGEDTVELQCTLPPGSRIGGLIVRLVLSPEGRVLRIEQSMIQAPPPAELPPIVLSDEMKANIDNALANGNPMLVTYVDGNGRPKMSYRGTVHARGDDQLALWNRDREGGMTRALAENANLSFYLRDTTNNATYFLYGRGRVEDDPAVREEVFLNSPEREQNFDFSRRGVAIVVDLDHVEGSGPGGRFAMARAAQ